MSAAAKQPALLLLLALSLATLVPAADRWKIQYFYDHSDSIFDIQDFRCPSPQRCIGAGVISEKSGHEQGQVITSADGGLHWSLSPVKEHPVALFFLDESLGWMVTDRGIWTTQEGGRSWNKLETLKGLVGVQFLDASHGYAIGFPKAVYETTDGGRKWAKLAAASDAPGDPQQIIYDCISFLGPRGVIAGSIDPSVPVPSRRNPAKGASETPAGDNTLMLGTSDGGKNWTAKPGRVDGKLAKLSIANSGMVVAIVDYTDKRKPNPSEVFGTLSGSNERRTIFAQYDRAVLDIALLPNANAIIAAVEPPGNSKEIPIPGKLKMLESNDLEVWREMSVDYRAVAQQAVLAAPDAGHIWVATDTGMILKLAREGGAR